MNERIRAWAANARENAGHFVSAVATAVLYADDENYALIEPVVVELIKKYPSYLEKEWPKVLADIPAADRELNEDPLRTLIEETLGISNRGDDSGDA